MKLNRKHLFFHLKQGDAHIAQFSAERASTQELINKAFSNYKALHDHFETETSSLRARAKGLEDIVDKQAKENVSALQQVA